MTIYDGGSNTLSMFGKYCGNSIPPSHISSSNEMLIQFQSDGSLTEAGFKIEYNPTCKQNTSIQFKTTLNIIKINAKIFGIFILCLKKR